MFMEHFLNWYDAETFCKTTNGHLVALETPEEQEFLVDYIRQTNSKRYPAVLFSKQASAHFTEQKQQLLVCQLPGMNLN